MPDPGVYCGACGWENPPRLKLCLRCGASIGEPEPEPKPEPEAESEPPRNPLWTAALVGYLVLALVLGIIIFPQVAWSLSYKAFGVLVLLVPAGPLCYRWWSHRHW
ncbi:MAG: hypothetical protein IPI67_07470 [Myxococcales bacterium]|nr:hypothetical protein [Myxococcales bacterium]